VTRPELCVGAVAVVDEELLLVRRGRGPGAGRWSVPGGRVESGETIRDAVVREVAEETGLRVRCDELLGWAERIGPQDHFVILDFAVTVTDGRRPMAGDDAADARWFPLSSVPEVALVDGLADFLRDHGVL
jgi:acetyl-CoA carboxylase carboxyl transferase subunit beta